MSENKNIPQEISERVSISSELLSYALGFLATLPVYQSMELITRIKMDIVPIEKSEMVKAKEPKTVNINK